MNKTPNIDDITTVTASPLTSDQILTYRQHMANPGNLLLALGLNENHLSDEIKEEIYMTWEIYLRFFPPKERYDDTVAYYLNQHQNFLNIKKTILDIKNIDNEYAKKSLYDNLIINQGILMPRVDLPDWNFLLTDKATSNGSKIKSSIVILRSLTNILMHTEENVLEGQQLMNTYTYEFLDYIFLSAISSTTDSFGGEGSLISAIEWLYYANNTKVWIRNTSSSSMQIFNSILEIIGYKAIPIGFSDFASFSLPIEHFTAYILYVMHHVEKQEIIHTIPDCFNYMMNLTLDDVLFMQCNSAI